VVCELVPSAIESIAGEVWSGHGSLLLTGASELSPVHRLPIVGEVNATALRNATFVLHHATDTYSLTRRQLTRREKDQPGSEWSISSDRMKRFATTSARLVALTGVADDASRSHRAPQ
jgi:hypothetical protein